MNSQRIKIQEYESINTQLIKIATFHNEKNNSSKPLYIFYFDPIDSEIKRLYLCNWNDDVYNEYESSVDEILFLIGKNLRAKFLV